MVQNQLVLYLPGVNHSKPFGFDKSDFQQKYLGKSDSTDLKLKFAINVLYAHCYQQMGV